MIQEAIFDEYYTFFMLALLVSMFGALMVAIADSKQNRALVRPTSKLGRPIPQH